MADFDFVLKIIILGDNRVGKSSFILKYSQNIFSDQQNQPRLFGIDYMTKIVDIKLDVQSEQNKQCEAKNFKVKLILWDPAGCEKHRTLNQTYYRGSDAVVLLYDISQPLSLEAIAEWVTDVDSHTHKSICKMLLANKVDLRYGSDVQLITQEMGQNVSNYYNIDFFEVSAKDGTNIEQAMNQLVKQIILKKLSDGELEDNINTVQVTQGGQRQGSSCC